MALRPVRAPASISSRHLPGTIEASSSTSNGSQRPSTRTTPKIVFSKTLERATWGKYAEAKVVRTSATEAVKRLKEQPGKDMVMWGSLSLARSLMKAGLIDQYRLVVCPVVLGKGAPLFGDDAPKLELRLQETKPFDRGEVLLEYTL
jgi:dihydrofolate reductase